MNLGSELAFALLYHDLLAGCEGSNAETQRGKAATKRDETEPVTAFCGCTRNLLKNDRFSAMRPLSVNCARWQTNGT
jgi:hypothetical protein